jgi:pimeloyl-ACP methyl ester carboxylesterase
MSRFFLDPDAVDRVAAILRDVAADLEQRASRIEGLLEEAGKFSRAPQDARYTAERHGNLGEDLRNLAQLVREADAQGVPRPLIDLLIGRPWEEARAALGSAGPAQVLGWWRRLSFSQQAWLKVHQREVIAGLDGIPVDVRDEVNRQRVTTRLWELYAERARLVCTATPEGRAHLKRIEKLITAHEAMLAPDLKILLYDPTGDGRAAVAIGDVTTAAHIGVMVPGTGTGLDDFGGMIRNARALDVEAKRQGSTDHAVVAWLGYRTPPNVLMAGTKGYAQAGSKALAPFVSGLRAVSTQCAEVTVIGHSYGSTVTGMAAEGGMRADRIVLVGSPGIDARNVKGLRMDPEDVYVARVPDDPIRLVFSTGEVQNYMVSGPAGLLVGKVVGHDPDVHGPDPSSPAFGATPLPYDNKSHGHSGYYVEGSLALENNAHVMLGQPVKREKSEVVW